MAALTLDAWNDRLEIGGDCGGVAADACLEIMGTLLATECKMRVRRGSGILAYGDSVGMQLGEVTHTRFEHCAGRMYERSLALRSGSENPFDEPVSLIGASNRPDLNAFFDPMIREHVPVAGFAHRPVRHVLSESALERGHHGV